METVITVGIVVLAAAGVIFGFCRRATGDGSCKGCDGCSNAVNDCKGKIL